MQYEIEIFEKADCLIKYVFFFFLKKMCVWLVFIKIVIWEINYQKGQYIYKRIISYYDFPVIIIIIKYCYNSLCLSYYGFTLINSYFLD